MKSFIIENIILLIWSIIVLLLIDLVVIDIHLLSLWKVLFLGGTVGATWSVSKIHFNNFPSNSK